MRGVRTTTMLIALTWALLVPRFGEAGEADEAARARAARGSRIDELLGDQGHHERSLSRDLLVLQRQEDAVRLVLDGRIRIWGWPWHVERGLSVSDSFRRADHHASVVHTVVAIDDEGLHLRADSRFQWEGEVTEASEAFCLPYSTPWQEAAYDGNVEAMRALLGKPKTIDRRDGEGRTALMVAVYRGHEDAVQWLLENRADVDAMSDGENAVTPLMLAARHQPQTVGPLLEAGANPNLLNPNDDGPLYVGIRNAEVVRTLFDAGVQPDSIATQKAFSWAAREGPIETIQLFLDRGVDVNAHVHGRSLLWWVSGIHGKRKEPGLQDRVVQMLIEAGAEE